MGPPRFSNSASPVSGFEINPGWNDFLERDGRFEQQTRIRAPGHLVQKLSLIPASVILLTLPL